MAPITVLLADDNMLVRSGVRMLLSLETDLRVIGEAGDFDGAVALAEELAPDVLVTDIRMPPSFSAEGIEAAKLIRKRHPGTGVVVLSQFDDPEYAIGLLADGAAGYAYLLKDGVSDAGRLVRAVREVAAGGSMLDPEIVAALVTPATDSTGLTAAERVLLQFVGEGKPVKAIAATLRQTPEAVDQQIDALFLHLARVAAAGTTGGEALRLLKSLHAAILSREEQGETLSRLLPSGIAAKLRDPAARNRTERLSVTVLMSDVRGYSGIAEHTDPSLLARQLGEHRRQMNSAVLGEGGTVMQYVGDAVMAVFGAPESQPDHAACAVRAAREMHRLQAELDEVWGAEGLEPFGMGIGISTGLVAAALLGSEERLEYTVVGDTVNLAQRLNDLARPAGTTVLSAATFESLGGRVDAEPMGDQLVKGRTTPVATYRIVAADPVPSVPTRSQESLP